MHGLREGFQLAGRYVLIKPLRSGGRAVLWQALDKRTGVQVAIKFSRSGSAAELSVEFENLQTLSHPAIVEAQELGKVDGEAFLVLELIDGIELSQYMGAACTVWLPMLQTVVQALEHAHSRGVVHGDLKLENMLVSPDGGVHLVDFGGGPGRTVADDMRALADVISELATGQALPAVPPDRLPAALGQLMTEMRAADPVSPGAVAVTIDAVLNDEMKPNQSEQFERIEPVGRQVEASGRQSATAASSARVWPMIATAGVVLIAAVAIVALWPRIFSNNGDTATVVDDRQDEARARLQNLTVETEAERTLVYQKWQDLQNMKVGIWAELRANKAIELLQEGERQASEMNHVAALRLFGESNELFSALLEQAPGIAADRREAGWQAYRSGDAKTAAAHFDVVLAIEPNDEEVRAARIRTAFLEQITTLTRQARELEAKGDLSGALAAMKEAIRIDSDSSEIEQEIARLETELASTGFQATMSQVYAALRAGNHAGARQFLRKAGGLRPGAPELQDARIQLDMAERDARIASLRARAVEAERTEDWETAIQLYSELLLIDSALVLAQQGRDRSRRLATLTAKAESLLDTPLTKNDARRQADTLLEQIATVEAQSPTLRSMELKLKEAVRLSRLPVKVRFQSDNLTNIQVNRVGRLGVFERHELELMPGHYTVVGTRAGYRDVRTELIVEAGKEPTLVIRCEEQI